MPVETFGFPDSLNASNPVTSEGIVQGDDHIRGIKSTIKATFPNITGAITATQAEINTLSTGVVSLSDSGAYFKTSGDGFANALAGDIDVMLQGSVAATFQRTGGVNFLKVKGALQVDTTITATGALTAPGMCPIGAVLIWPSDTLPPSTEGVFAWCNGAAYSRTTYATCYGRIGNGNVDGTTFNVPNYQEVTLVGKSGMGGATSPGLLASIASGIKTVLGSLFGNDTTTLGTTNLPAYTPSGAVSTTTSSSAFVSGVGAKAGIVNVQVSATTGGHQVPDGYGDLVIASTSSSTFSGNAQGGSSAPFSNCMPARITGFIIRLA